MKSNSIQKPRHIKKSAKKPAKTKKLSMVINSPEKVPKILSPLYNANIITLSRSRIEKPNRKFSGLNSSYQNRMDNTLLSEYIFNDKRQMKLSDRSDKDANPSTTRSTAPIDDSYGKTFNTATNRYSPVSRHIELPRIKNKQIMIEFSPVRFADTEESDIPIEILPILPMTNKILRSSLQGAKFMLDKRLNQ
ncbi:unnamed protein product [Blepharisma stoltei]|uniref:Uncharacterized protein n=1 Tax=Blepharisma stoltei TaxID=1481888 RepID=A0AAU9K224_9CILI|nr:unnamed protein product [Blepharisma stoltei]